MPQGILPYKYEEEKNDTGMTALAGLAVYLDLAHMIGLSDSIGEHMLGEFPRGGQMSKSLSL